MWWCNGISQQQDDGGWRRWWHSDGCRREEVDVVVRKTRKHTRAQKAVCDYVMSAAGSTRGFVCSTQTYGYARVFCHFIHIDYSIQSRRWACACVARSDVTVVVSAAAGAHARALTEVYKMLLSLGPYLYSEPRLCQGELTRVVCACAPRSLVLYRGIQTHSHIYTTKHRTCLCVFLYTRRTLPTQRPCLCVHTHLRPISLYQCALFGLYVLIFWCACARALSLWARAHVCV